MVVRGQLLHVARRGAPRGLRDHAGGLLRGGLLGYLKESGTRLGEEAFESYLEQWRGEEGQEAFVRQAAQLEERHTAEFEPRLGSIEVPVRVVWGGADAWLDPSQADRLAEAIPGSSLVKVADAGHFVMEDAAGEVAEILGGFFAAPR